MPGFLYMETRDGEQKIKCDRIIARMGSSPPRKFVEECGIEFTSADKDAYPSLSPQFETTVPGIYVIGALAGYPLIKHCMNQGYDVGRVHQRQCRAEARRRADPGEEVRRSCPARAASPNGSPSSAAG